MGAQKDTPSSPVSAKPILTKHELYPAGPWQGSLEGSLAGSPFSVTYVLGHTHNTFIPLLV